YITHNFILIVGWQPRHKKTHSRFPAVGSCRKFSYSRQAPAASPSTTTPTLRTACRIKSITGGKASGFRGIGQVVSCRQISVSGVFRRLHCCQARGYLLLSQV